MITICDREKCPGCRLCEIVCPVNAITFAADSRGFHYPFVSEALCVKCGLCQRSCPQNTPEIPKITYEQKAFAAWSCNRNIRKTSSSGGIFSELAAQVLKNGGAVCGAAFSSDFSVRHIFIESSDELSKLRGSKYVQSDISSVYPALSSRLKKQNVLFVGTPCQVAAIKKFVNMHNLNSANLYTCDLVCHGAPSPLIWQEYLNDLKRKYKSIPQEISFRNKDDGWVRYNMKIIFANGKTYKKNSPCDCFSRGFLRELISRECCGTCDYASPYRQGDLTLCDFWGYKAVGEFDRDTDEGISLVIINNSHGDNLWQQIENKIVKFPRDVQQAMQGNRCFHKAFPNSPLRETFWRDYLRRGYEFVRRKYLYPDKKTKIKRSFFIKAIMRKILVFFLGKESYSSLVTKIKKRMGICR